MIFCRGNHNLMRPKGNLFERADGQWTCSAYLTFKDCPDCHHDWWARRGFYRLALFLLLASHLYGLTFPKTVAQTLALSTQECGQLIFGGQVHMCNPGTSHVWEKRWDVDEYIVNWR